MCYSRSSEVTKLHTRLEILTSTEKQSLLQNFARPDFIRGCHRSPKSFHQVSGSLSVTLTTWMQVGISITCSCTQLHLNPCITDSNITLASLATCKAPSDSFVCLLLFLHSGWTFTIQQRLPGPWWLYRLATGPVSLEVRLRLDHEISRTARQLDQHRDLHLLSFASCLSDMLVDHVLLTRWIVELSMCLRTLTETIYCLSSNSM
jgi:hypothetical protein